MFLDWNWNLILPSFSLNLPSWSSSVQTTFTGFLPSFTQFILVINSLILENEFCSVPTPLSLAKTKRKPLYRVLLGFLLKRKVSHIINVLPVLKKTFKVFSQPPITVGLFISFSTSKLARSLQKKRAITSSSLEQRRSGRCRCSFILFCFSQSTSFNCGQSELFSRKRNSISATTHRLGICRSGKVASTGLGLDQCCFFCSRPSFPNRRRRSPRRPGRRYRRHQKMTHDDDDVAVLYERPSKGDCSLSFLLL